MSELTVRAISEEVGLRRETSVVAEELPLWLARLHQALPVGDLVKFTLSGDLSVSIDRILEGAGFAVDNGLLVRLDTLPDIVAANMRTLVCGLNPSPHAAESGVGFSRPGNRFWPAAIESGLVSADRDPLHALLQHDIGFTDLVKRTTKRADEISTNEFLAGVARMERLTDWLRPEVLVMVGLTGWRQGVDSKATAGWQPTLLGPTSVYLMPSTSGLNGHESPDSLAAHLRQAQTRPATLDPTS